MTDKKNQSTSPGFIPSRRSRLAPKDRERKKSIKGAILDMQKHGFKTVEELETYYDSKRGY